MKKVILSLAIVALSATAATAQVQFGAKAGINLADFSGSDADETSMKVDFHVGGLVNIPVTASFSVQPELVYSGQGAKLDGGKYNLGYINVPVMAKYVVSNGFFVQAGPQIGFLLSAKAKPDNGPSVDVKDGLKSIDFSLAAGLGYMFTPNVGVDARYVLGLTSIDEDDAKVNNAVIQVGVFYLLGSKKGKK